jgi:hypothetical protein
MSTRNNEKVYRELFEGVLDVVMCQHVNPLFICRLAGPHQSLSRVH